jgi:TolB-like protein
MRYVIRTFVIRTFVGSCLLLVSGAITSSASAAEPVETPSANGGKILILPFAALNPSEYQAWLGRSIQQSIAADLTAAAPGRVIQDDHQPADEAAATDLGKTLGARYVVRGSFVIANGNVRMTGEVLDLAVGKSIAALKSTGTVNDVFVLEDSISRQIKHALPLGEKQIAADSEPKADVPAFESLHVQPAPVTDAYTEAYGSPVNASASQSQGQYDYYYSNGGDFGGFYSGWGCPIGGFGFGIGCASGFGANGSASNHWNGRFASGFATTGGVSALGGGFGVNVEGVGLRARGAGAASHAGMSHAGAHH